MTAEDRVASAFNTLPGQHIVSSSFGAQSAVMLHLVTQQQADIPVVLIDSGYLFPETYQFVDELANRLSLNLKVYAPETSAAWQEAKHGKRWEQGLAGLEAYNQDNKVEPMQRAIEELNVGTWFSGLRRNQSIERAKTPFVERSGDRFKVYPIADWTDKDIYDYLKKHDLPYHPLWEKGYVSIGDVHTTRSLAHVDSVEETRFFGLKRECGLHELDFGKSFQDAQTA
jgi:phosphoadenosine phosphosulfate reductase